MLGIAGAPDLDAAPTRPDEPPAIVSRGEFDEECHTCGGRIVGPIPDPDDRLDREEELEQAEAAARSMPRPRRRRSARRTTARDAGS